MNIWEKFGVRQKSNSLKGKQGEQGQEKEIEEQEHANQFVQEEPLQQSETPHQSDRQGPFVKVGSLAEFDEKQDVNSGSNMMASMSQNTPKDVVSGELSVLPAKKLQQRLYMLVNDFESSKLAILFSLVSLGIIATDIILLVIETDPSLDLPEDIWVRVNMGISGYFLVEYLLRLIAYNAFDESVHEFITKPFNLVDLLALSYSAGEIIVYLSGTILEQRVKILRMLIVLRMIRIFKFSTFSKGVKILIKGLSESIQALTILLFFTMICVILMSSFIYFVEKEFSDYSLIQNIPQAIWWAIITITTVGYGDLVPMSFPGKIIGALALVFGVLLLSLPVAIIGNKFQEIYLSNQREETQLSRKKTKVTLFMFMNQMLYQTSNNQDEKEIYRIILKLNELEEVNETIEKCLQDNQFLYRSITRDAQNLIDKIELHQHTPNVKRGEHARVERVQSIREQILQKRKLKRN